MKNKKLIAIIIIVALVALIYFVEAKKNAPTDAVPADTSLSTYGELESKISAGATGNETLPGQE